MTDYRTREAALGMDTTVTVTEINMAEYKTLGDISFKKYGGGNSFRGHLDFEGTQRKLRFCVGVGDYTYASSMGTMDPTYEVVVLEFLEGTDNKTENVTEEFSEYLHGFSNGESAIGYCSEETVNELLEMVQKAVDGNEDIRANIRLRKLMILLNSSLQSVQEELETENRYVKNVSAVIRDIRTALEEI